MFVAVRVCEERERRRMLLKIETSPSLIANAIKPIGASSKDEAGTAALLVNGLEMPEMPPLVFWG